MTYLLDTHVWLWMLVSSSRLGPEAGELVRDPRTSLVLSAVSAWEIAIKHGQGRLPLPEPISTYLPDRMHRTGVRALPVTHDHAAAVADLPPHHRDPFDRLLVAQAQLEGMTLITADQPLSAYDVPVLLVNT